jgi:RNAse (barnase) inhibitor barstar
MVKNKMKEKRKTPRTDEQVRHSCDWLFKQKRIEEAYITDLEQKAEIQRGFYQEIKKKVNVHKEKLAELTALADTLVCFEDRSPTAVKKNQKLAKEIEKEMEQ